MKHATGWLIGLVAVILIATLGWFNRYNIYDWYRLHDYTPPTAIIQLANQTTMTPYARKLFYVYHPIIEGSAAFNQDCQVTAQAIVLGCTAINKGIWLYNVQTPQLNGVEQVTAAHEMLHVAYSRLSSSKLKYINNLVMATYNKLAPNDPLLRSEYQSYLKTEGAGAVPNELHSVLGTEISKLPSALETYYAQYFTNRQAIVNYANSYEGAFTQRQAQVQKDDQQLSTWQKEISSDEQTLQTEDQQIQAQSAQLNQERSSGQTNAYNSGVPAYNQAVDSYNTLIGQTKQLIDQYNTLVASRNSIAVSEDKLIQSISSLPSSISSQ
jgi:flagellar biosynthesis/type III secretory pathway protein FliH